MTTLITVLGVVQGVGFRPFVAELADELNLSGTVKNSGGIVQITASAEKEAIDNFVNRLELRPPQGAVVEKVITERLPNQHFDGFKIIESNKFDNEIPMLPPDLPICDDCKKELYNKQNRRYRYPFISCVSCGPRYSIIESIPFDRESTTMDEFAMCEACEKEYKEEHNRRRHAQTISCHDCGPQLILKFGNDILRGEEALNKGIELLRNGEVLAVKGIGGYQFTCLPTNKKAVENLRLLKNRDKKPFAVMFDSLESVKEYCHVSGEEEALVTSSAYPIVLLNMSKDAFCNEVSGESRFLGAFLAYTPLHQLLCDALGPLVMTSGNLTSEPIIINDEEMLSLSSPYLSGVLYNERKIITPLDDSVARVIQGQPQLIRRSRGYVPRPVIMNKVTDKAVLSMGGDLKSGFCLYHHNRAHLSQYFGDLDHDQNNKAYLNSLTHMENLFGIHPKIIVCDLHPQYRTTTLAKELSERGNCRLVGVQHHHAHAASVMAEHGLDTCIGVLFDGTGYGTDGAVWGGEFLLCRNTEYTRPAHLKYVKLCGGDTAAKKASLTAYSYLNAVGQAVDNNEFKLIQSAIENNINTQNSSSMGRLFDAVCAILEIKNENTYEGECAIALENIAAESKKNGINPYPFHFKIEEHENGLLIDQTGLFEAIYFANRSVKDKGALSHGFHIAIAEMIRDVCDKIRSQSGENNVCLSGGVFANFLLTNYTINLLKDRGFTVYLNKNVPTNDSGIPLGQAWILGR